MKKGVDYPGIVVVFVCHDGKGNYLFAKRGAGSRDAHGVWELAGGGLKFGETVEAGMLRELKEEFSTTPLNYDFLGYYDLIREQEGALHHWIAMSFLVEIDPQTVSIGEPEKCEAIAWHTLDNLPSPLHIGVMPALEKVKNFLNV